MYIITVIITGYGREGEERKEITEGVKGDVVGVVSHIL